MRRSELPVLTVLQRTCLYPAGSRRPDRAGDDVRDAQPKIPSGSWARPPLPTTRPPSAREPHNGCQQSVEGGLGANARNLDSSLTTDYTRIAAPQLTFMGPTYRDDRRWEPAPKEK